MTGFVSGPPGGNGQDIFRSQPIKESAMEHKRFVVDKPLFETNLRCDSISGLEQIPAQIDLLKNLFDNVSTADIPHIEASHKRILSFPTFFKQHGQGLFILTQKGCQFTDITSGQIRSIPIPGVAQSV